MKSLLKSVSPAHCTGLTKMTLKDQDQNGMRSLVFALDSAFTSLRLGLHTTLTTAGRTAHITAFAAATASVACTCAATTAGIAAFQSLS